MDNYRIIARALIQKSEKCVLVGYPDQGGVPTIGFGHTGPDVKLGQSITREQADFLLDQNIAGADHHLTTGLTDPAAFAALDEHEKAALLDFVFNSGGGPSKGEPKSWQIWKDVNSGNLADVPDQFDRFTYVHVNGKAVTSAGLKNRRAAEKTLWNTADLDAAAVVANAGGHTVSSGATRVLPTPPVPDKPKAFAKISLWLKGSGLVAGAGGFATKAFTPDGQAQAQNVADTAAAHAASFGHFGPAIASVAGGAVVVIAAGMMLVHVLQSEAAKV